MFEKDEYTRTKAREIFRKLSLDPVMLTFFEELSYSLLMRKSVLEMSDILDDQETNTIEPANNGGLMYILYPIFEQGYIIIDANKDTEGFFTVNDNYFVFRSNCDGLSVSKFNKDDVEDFVTVTKGFGDIMEMENTPGFKADDEWNLSRTDKEFDKKFNKLILDILGGDQKVKVKTR